MKRNPFKAVKPKPPILAHMCKVAYIDSRADVAKVLNRPVTGAGERLSAAQAKRERKAAKRAQHA